MSFYLPHIERHTKAIQSYYYTAPTEIKTILAAIASNEEANNAFSELLTYWKKIELFAHCNAGELLDVLEKHVLPLERAYEYLEAETVGIKSKQSIKENVIQLKTIKQKILEGLFLRCQVHKDLKKDPYVDDVLAVMINQINQNNLSEEFLIYPPVVSSALNDDRRLVIYDYLRQAGYSEAELEEHVLAPIIQRELPEVKKTDRVKQLIQKIDNFRKKILKKSGITKQGSDPIAALNRLLEQGLDLIAAQTSIPLPLLRYSRYFLYFGLSLITYYLLSMSLSPIIFMLLGEKATLLTTNLLFYTIGISPAWGLIWNIGADFVAKIYDYLIQNKKKDILNGLIVFENTTHFMAEKLNTPIIDISHFDIQNLIENTQYREKELNEAYQALKTFSLVEKLTCSSRIKEQNNRLREKLKSQMAKLNHNMASLAKKIADEIENEIEFLETSFEKQVIKPRIPLKQVEKWTQFIKKYGSAEDLSNFIQKANPINIWVKKILKGTFLIPFTAQQRALDTPWGTHQCRTDAIRGWETILKSFSIDQPKTNAAIELCRFLRGKISVSAERLNEIVSTLGLVEEDKFKDKIQEHIFRTLTGRVAENASLLTQANKQLIADWHRQNKPSIQAAYRVLASILNGSSVQVDPSFVGYLDADDIYLYSMDLIYDETQRRNSLRVFFNKYTGERDIYDLVNFIPQAEYVETVTQLASIRLHWILTNKSEFSDNDLALFNNPKLKERFNFNDEVLKNRLDLIQNAAYLKQFEETCRRKLLGDQSLFTNLTSLQNQLAKRSKLYGGIS